MHKKHTYRFILFGLLIILLDRSIGIALANFSSKYRYDNRIGLLLNDSLNKDIFIIGSSRALNGYSPKVIEEQTGKTCFNLAVSGSNIEFHETVLDLILLSKNKPKSIIYNLDDCATLSEFAGKIIYPIDQLYPYVNNDAVNKIVADRMDKKLWVTNLSLSYKQNVNLITSIKYIRSGKEKPSFEINNIDSYGSNLMEGKSKGYDNMVFQNDNPYKFEKVHQPFVNALKRIISTCKSNQIELVLVNPPIFYKKNEGFIEKIREISGGEVLLLDYSSLYVKNDFFYNHGHLNKMGAMDFSEKLTKDLIIN